MEEQLLEKERYFHRREAEIQRMLQAVEEREETMDLREDSLQQQLAALREREEYLCLKEGALTEQMATKRQGYAASRETDLISLVSTIRNSSNHTNVDPDPSSKNTARLKEDSEYLGNEGYQ